MLYALFKDDQMLATKNKDGVYELKLEYPAVFPYVLKLGTKGEFTPTDLAMELVKDGHDLVNGFDQILKTADYLGIPIKDRFTLIRDLEDKVANYNKQVEDTRVALEKEFCALYFQLANHLKAYASKANNGDQHYQYFHPIDINGPLIATMLMNLSEIKPTIEVCFRGIWPNISRFQMEPLVQEFKHSKDLTSETLLERTCAAKPKMFVSMFKKYIVPILAVPFRQHCMLEYYNVNIQHEYKYVPPPPLQFDHRGNIVTQSPKSKIPVMFTVTFLRVEKPLAKDETTEVTLNEEGTETVEMEAEAIGK